MESATAEVKPLVSYSAVPRLHQPDIATIHRDYLRKNKPVVVTGWMDGWPVRDKWTLPYLKERLGDTEVEVRHKTNTAAYRQGTTYFTKKIKFSDYVAEVEKGSKRARDQYLAVQNINRALPQIADDFVMPEFVPKLHRGPFLWIAPLEKVYPNPLGSAGISLQTQMDLSEYFGHEHEPEAVAAFARRFPKFRDVACQECVLNGGEVLFLPYGYWHQVTTTEVTISVNCFCGDPTGEFLPKLMAEGPLWDTFKYYMLNVIEQNRRMSTNQAFTFCSRRYSRDQFKAALWSFLWGRYKEELTEELLDQMIGTITAYCDQRDREQWPSPEAYAAEAARVQPVAKPPRIKIRGKNWRGGDATANINADDISKETIISSSASSS
ncbi:JmjC domain containing protein 5 (Jumonji domain-containing protein 5), putative [Acanthamoeba castellanii str. Neff]|uniref:JmjC domain containing protein 5 (Jumonji domain-containing protein 5), putative n=1 Tax=Acanthamoeba castellanii (strain ATCC 30010 / Neff) TaxID=1257118 RepID=L8H2E5_ACACF|nr:JmjC domain containing protein 5 (Jumonji domain-containing protein 5), putative [Acanthamoeba castellanii str. Neff]ELR19649.1 JmjC domain containing protein 5 (Jumonji domain-containing protein 5), putative [Acanthamoeba castellanii str. Neff]